MPHQESIPTSTSRVLADLLLRWRELREQGRHSSIEALCAEHPELIDALRQQVAALEAMEAMLGVGPNTETDPQAAAPEPAGDGSPLPAELPGYEILGVLNQGGMGIVYKARQLSLNRLVAVKMILSGSHAAPEQLARFRAEAEAVARLRHPNVVQIYEVGEHAGQPYFSMEFVDGGSLEQHLARAVLPARQAAQLIESLAHAVHAAHQLGIIHRDLKPANILLQRGEGRGARDEDQDSSSLAPRPSSLAPLPKITDFGLAKRLDQPAGTTRAGAVMGTPSYMAPEQAEGKNEAIGPGVDIYALGAILYEVLTGRPPFQGETTFDTLEQVRFREPVPPSRLQPRIPRDLETICLKCLEKDPHRRYATALALAEDLHCFLSGEPILARPSSLWSHSIKWARRKPALAALLAVSVLAVMSLLGSWAWFTVELSRQMQRAQEGEQHAREQEALARANQQLAEQQRTAAETGWRLANEQRRQAQQERERSDALLQRCLAAIDEHARATTTAKGEMHQTGEPGRILYGLARFFAQTSAALRQDTTLRPADREQLANQYAARAVTLLDSAAGAGYFGSTANLKQLRSDPGLDPLRAREDFRKLLAKVEKKLAVR